MYKATVNIHAYGWSAGNARLYEYARLGLHWCEGITQTDKYYRFDWKRGLNFYLFRGSGFPPVDFDACLRLPDAAGAAVLGSTGALPDIRSGGAVLALRPLLNRLSVAADSLPETTLSARLR